jgi:hypothetical protein
MRVRRRLGESALLANCSELWLKAKIEAAYLAGKD